MIAVGTSRTGEICLTFDDGPDPLWTPRILDALGEGSARATFFVITARAREHPRLIERMLSEGHEVALHCERHLRHTEIGADEILDDALRGLEDLDSLNVHPTCWRTPWGVVTDGTLRAADELGLKLVHWTEDTHDWRSDSSSRMFRLTAPQLRGGSIVLMHDGLGPGATRDGCGETVSLVARLLDGLRDGGLEAVTVAESYARENGGGQRRSTA